MKKILSFLLVLCFGFSVGMFFAACDQNPPPPTTTEVYTVTESEWKTNFNLTKGQQTKPLACTANVFAESEPIAAITSYTLSAVGVNDGANGTCVLKVAPNALSIDFYIENQFREDESGTYPANDDFYIGLVAAVTSYFPFADNYNNFTYNEAKKAYVAQNLTSIVVDETDISRTYEMYTQYAEVTFVNGYLNTITVDLCDETFTNVYSSFVFTFSDINNTIVNL